MAPIIAASVICADFSRLGEEVQQCPEVPLWTCGRNNSYGYNYKYVGSAREFPNPEGGTATVFERFPVGRVDAPSHTIAFGDSSGTGTKEPYEPIAFTQASSALGYDARKVLVGNHGYTLDPTYLPTRSRQLWNLKTSEDLYSDKQSPSFVAPRHRGRANLCMTDGHVECLTPQEIYADNSWWNGYGAEDPRDQHEAAKSPGLNARYGW
jgi:prepilin-type processing-associated H-X9-DG protein